MSTDGDGDGDGADAADGAHEGSHSHGGVRHTHAHGHSAHAHDFAMPDLPEAVDIFDTILRDGSQQEGLSLTVDDKLRVAEQLDHLGVTFIEGGWPGANPKDVEFFARAKKELTLDTATLVAFGSTRRAGVKPETDAVLANLVEAGAPIACIVAKSWDRHVAEALRTSLDEAVAMVTDSVRFLCEHDLRVFLDAEHFFDGYRRNPEFALSVLAAAEEAGAEALVLCDTNGGSLPDDVGQAVADVRERTSAQLGIHCHNDAGCAVANSLVAVQAGATQVQGCINGYGERAGNTDLSAAIPNLSLKLNIRTIPADRLERLTPVAHHIAELVNIAPNPQQPYVGNSVFAHKGGLHASAVARSADLYEHVEPNLVGNGTRVVVSEMAGRSTLAMKADELGLELDGEVIGRVLDELKRLEHEGYHFEVADGSLELLLRRATGWVADFFTVQSFRVITDHDQGSEARTTEAGDMAGVMTEATVKVHVGRERIVAVAEGNGPVNALDGALRAAIGARFPALDHIHLTDYRVRVLDTGRGTGAVTRVLVDTTDEQRTWTTIGVSENIIQASWQALYDSIVFGLLHAS
ncbi:MAG TPA: citramalate synthase [Acidimicrobiales bacterium]|jgi:2-isopropylmalate synthase|nr:citramalate synthase [Acidimicrobiales bacterium]